MFFRRSIDIELDENIIKKKKIPILLKDKTWLYIRDNCKNRAMDSISKELEVIIKEEANLQKHMRTMKEKKRVLMNKVINLSDLVNTKGEERYIPEIEKSKSEIEQINIEIDQTYDMLLEFPKKIEQVNLQLLKETVKVAYQNVQTNQTQLNSLDKEIYGLREKLNKLREEKEIVEKKVGILYGFLHTLVGADEMEKLDIKTK
ncbi:hypothetical protein [Serpentinicella alkaliphila]|uniref:Uncharacterized protein n=1 Tax=Serpentinicella alkaliphila TaxID=1734049 RepID=A0A4R2U8P6_9FIRM|nr:hypothetical protein [Serpentinicella alkaliphila]QUH25660.1 hypothetical protein HZR23_07850 [Serpentinicella alkaliphila]TCQ06629.1 hypothetical protein EDD79_100354 [Serpentinicella alkaliphila]